MKLGEAMYAAAQAEAGAGAAGEAPAEEGVVDAEFEEVDDAKKSA
jgi:molecular chaperone DnaK